MNTPSYAGCARLGRRERAEGTRHIPTMLHQETPSSIAEECSREKMKIAYFKPADVGELTAIMRRGFKHMQAPRGGFGGIGRRCAGCRPAGLNFPRPTAPRSAKGRRRGVSNRRIKSSGGEIGERFVGPRVGTGNPRPRPMQDPSYGRRPRNYHAAAPEPVRTKGSFARGFI